MNSCRHALSLAGACCPPPVSVERAMPGSVERLGPGPGDNAGGPENGSSSSLRENGRGSGSLIGRPGPKVTRRRGPSRWRSRHHSGSCGRKRADRTGAARRSACGSSPGIATTMISTGSEGACSQRSFARLIGAKATMPAAELRTILASTFRLWSNRERSRLPRLAAASRLPAKKPIRKNAATTLRKRMPPRLLLHLGGHELHRIVARHATVRRTPSPLGNKRRKIRMISVHSKRRS